MCEAYKLQTDCSSYSRPSHKICQEFETIVMSRQVVLQDINFFCAWECTSKVIQESVNLSPFLTSNADVQ